MLQLKNACKEGITKFAILVETGKVKILEVADLRGLYQTLLNLLSKKCKSLVSYFLFWNNFSFVGTKRDIYFGSSGIIVGIAIGIAIGISIKKKEQVVRYMQAIQCFNYLGIEVITNICSNWLLGICPHLLII